jgi:hypothetical protein
MMTPMNRLAGGVAVLVLFSGVGLSAAAKHKARNHSLFASRPPASHSTKSTNTSHAKHKRSHKTSHKHRTVKHQ